jgi:hypothetical protein
VHKACCTAEFPLFFSPGTGYGSTGYGATRITYDAVPASGADQLTAMT